MAHDLFMLTLKALEHPQGLEVIKAVRELRQEIQPELEPDPLLKIEAYNIAKSRGLRTPRHINQMTNAELATWVEQHSA